METLGGALHVALEICLLSLVVNTSNPSRRTKILFVCARNRIRSFTAEKMFAGSPLYDVRSRGVAKDARIRLTGKDLGWADLIFVMEKEHKNRIARQFRSAIVGKRIVCLFIEDIYGPMEEDLIAVLRQKLAPHLPAKFSTGPHAGNE